MSHTAESDGRRVRVTFKPVDVKPVEASDVREVVFRVEGDIPDDTTLFHNAKAEAVDQGVIADPQVAKSHWEAYTYDLID